MSLGTAYVAIKADTKPLQQGLDAGHRMVSTTLSGMGGLFKGLFNTIFSLKGLVTTVFAGMAVKKVVDGFIEAGTAAEGYQVRLKVLLGSVEEGNRLFSEMSSFAASVPFTYKEIMGSATALSGVMKGGVDEVTKWMPLIADLAAAAGMGIEETTGQVIRMYSAGAASADMFRERGILAMLGFQAGVSYSAEETRRKLFAAWESSESKFKGSTKELAKTWSGLTSMLEDAWFLFQNKVKDSGLWDYMKGALSSLLDKINELKTKGELDKWAKGISGGLINIFDRARALLPELESISKWLIGLPKSIDSAVTYWKVFGQTVSEFGKIGSEALRVAGAFWKDFFMDVAGWVNSLITKFETLTSKVKTFWSTLKSRGLGSQDNAPVIMQSKNDEIAGWRATLSQPLSETVGNDVIISFLGEGSTVKPLSEKIDEMTSKMLNFGSELDNLNPTVTADFSSITQAIARIRMVDIPAMRAALGVGSGDIERYYRAQEANLYNQASNLAQQTAIQNQLNSQFASGNFRPGTINVNTAFLTGNRQSMINVAQILSQELNNLNGRYN